MFSSALKSFTSNISSNYSLSTKPSSLSGPWKVYDAKSKSTGKTVSVFVFERKSLEHSGTSFGGRSGSSNLKRFHDEIIDRLKKEASSLARLRHPSILELVEPVEETRNGGLMFATEQVTASLAGLLEEKTEQERSGGVGGRGSRYVVEDSDGRGKRRRELEIDELEIQKGLLQVGKGLEFLHESANLVHANLTPEAIFINAKSDWKISGLGFATPPDNAQGHTTVAPISLSEVLNYDARLPRSVQLNVDFTSPDFVLDTNITQSADMFSLGLVVIALYNSPHRSPLETSNSLSQYKRIFSSPSSIPQHNNNFLCKGTLPKDILSDLLPKLITRRPAQRYSARDFQQAQYFDNVLVSTIRFLESLPAKTPNEKSQFMRGLPRILPQFPKSVLEKKVLPALLEETKDLELLSLVLQSAFKAIDLVPNGRRALEERLLPAFRQTFRTPSKSQDTSREGGLVVVLEGMPTITKNCGGKEFKDDVLPIIYIALESPTHSVVDKALKTLPTILPVLDFSTIKNELFPVIAAVFSKTSSLAIKIRGLEALNVLCGGSNTPAELSIEDDLNGTQTKTSSSSSSSAILDKYTVQEKVVPLLKGIKTKEPAVMLAALAVFKQVGKVADTDYLAIEVLPSLWSLSLGPLLNLEQFQGFMSLIKSLSSRIEHEQIRKLSELNSTSGATAGVGTSSFSGSATAMNGASGTDEATDFESLVSGRKQAKQDDLFDGGWSQASAAPSRPNIARNQSVQSGGDAPRFSWSSPATAASPSQQFPPSGINRTITPDNLGSFAALTPQSRSASSSMGQPPMQPQGLGSTGISGMSMPTMQPQSHRAAGSIPTMGTPIDWSRASTNTGANWSSPQNHQSSNSLGSFGIAPPAVGQAGGMTVQLPNRSGAAGMGGHGGSMGGTSGQGASSQSKSGLSKYESLI